MIRLLVPLFLFTVVACGGGGGDPAPPIPPRETLVELSGFAQKGPFRQGATVVATVLGINGAQTSRTFTTTVKSDLGDFDIEVPQGQTILLEITGNFYEEMTKQEAPASLRSVVMSGSANAGTNVNLLTHLMADAITSGLANGQNLAQAQATSRARIVEAFTPWLGAPQGNTPFHELNLIDFADQADADNGYLLAATALILQYARLVQPGVDELPGVSLLADPLGLSAAAAMVDLDAFAESLLLDSGMLDQAGITALLPQGVTVPTSRDARMALIADLLPHAAQFQVTMPAVTMVTVSGFAQKGPFRRGATVVVDVLDITGAQTGQAFTTRVNSDLGDFDIQLPAGQLIQLLVDGSFYDELTKQQAPASLRAVMKLGNANSTVNLNVLTEMTFDQALARYAAGDSFADAQANARTELINLLRPWLGSPRGAKPFHELNLFNFAGQTDADNGYLLAATALILKYAEVEQASQLALPDPSLQSVIQGLNTAAATVDLKAFTESLLLDSGVLDQTGITALLPPGVTVPASRSARMALIADLLPDASGFLMTDSTMVRAHGFAQKGPFRQSATVVATVLNRQGAATSRTFTTRVKSNLGDFEMELPAGEIIQLEVSGDFYDEVAKQDATVNLMSVVRTDKTTSTWNINLLTHLIADDVITKLRGGMSIGDALRTAKEDLTRQLATWVTAPQGTKDFHELNLIDFADHKDADNGYLLAVSALMLEYVKRKGMTLTQVLGSAFLQDTQNLSDAADAVNLETFAESLLLASGVLDVTGVSALLPPGLEVPACRCRSGSQALIDNLVPDASQFLNQSRFGHFTLVFEGKWTATSHGTRPGGHHFTTLIGATHSSAIYLWRPGELASPGLELVAELGGTSIIETEIAAHITAGHASSQVKGGLGSGGGEARGQLTFCTSTAHPLVSLATMVAPSPDWFLGLRDEALRDMGDWISQKTINLLPYDAGTEEGSGFSLSNPATSPHRPVARVSEGALANTQVPMATITITRDTTKRGACP